jgi:hypothetical protein
VLRYYDRDSVVDLIVVKMGQPVVLFLGGAAVVISDEALSLLTAQELQGMAGHELRHEYFWNEWQQARLNKQYDKMQEIELRCDGLAIISMEHLDLDPSRFISGISKLASATNKLAESRGDGMINGDYYTSNDERISCEPEDLENRVEHLPL